MKEVTATAATVDEAVQLALNQLGISKDRAEVTVLDEGKKGFLGLFNKPAVVKVKVLVNPIEEAETFLKNIIQKMGVEASVERIESEKEIRLIISGEKIGLLIGKHGQTLNSLQLLTQLVVNRYAEHYVPIIVDAENYRERRKEALVQLAHKLAEKAIKTGQEVKLEPLPAYERKIIHAVLSDNRKVTTFSVGTEPHRYIVVAPVK
ncbi:RNA-binding cell elongation regulator Jag/EloR [Thermaerobacillus caldiproteolyticus]|uniref:RNA-binding protein KhpB n=1 Tax=Thermaerobacillus caldiproteolyticus TaxID=247480 RepID=A0A7V9Z5C8_9BACL|nr:RNA-binding cell elongation regulator Jag/EloR [Anoxybacillus caldiproteolyticus]MBA2874334.1 spoIIIJ-associated protein [Anoxybacillus caldiproteolyticus]QPA30952.1 protein jag [Anoxybacillus caldiproteolyticus]